MAEAFVSGHVVGRNSGVTIIFDIPSLRRASYFSQTQRGRLPSHPGVDNVVWICHTLPGERVAAV